MLDALVADLMHRLARTFASERDRLKSGWAGGDAVSTEDLCGGLSASCGSIPGGGPGRWRCRAESTAIVIVPAHLSVRETH
jgi:hypothetical protein